MNQSKRRFSNQKWREHANQPLPEHRTPTLVAVYDRSIRGQHGSASAMRRDAMKNEIVERGYTITAWYVDDALDTVSFAERPGGARLLADARSGTFQRVVVAGLDSLSHQLQDVLAITEQLHPRGIVVESLSERFDTSDTGTFLLRLLELATTYTSEHGMLEGD